MADSPTKSERRQASLLAPVEEPDEKAPESPVEETVEEPETSGVIAPPVKVELDPDFELPEGEDTVSVEVGSYEPVELTRGKSVEVELEHARLLDNVPAVRRTE